MWPYNQTSHPVANQTKYWNNFNEYLMLQNVERIVYFLIYDQSKYDTLACHNNMTL